MRREFKITLPLDNQYVLRSMPDAQGGERPVMLLRGWASDTSVDKLNGKMSENCIVRMVRTVNESAPVWRNLQSVNSEIVKIDWEHDGSYPNLIGRATGARAIYEMTPEMRAAGAEPPIMEVEIEVDLRKSHGKDLQVALDDGEQLGLSIFGKVVKAHKEVVRSVNGSQKTIEHFDDVELKRIAITSRPVNNITWVKEIRRSMPEDEMETVDTIDTDGQESAEESVEAPAIDTTAVAQENPETEAPETPAADAMETPTEQEGTSEAQAEEAIDIDIDNAAPTAEAEPVAESGSEEVAPEEPQVELVNGLAPDAIADLMAMGAIVDPAQVPQPIATAEPVVETPAAAPEAISEVETVEVTETPAEETSVEAVSAVSAPDPEAVEGETVSRSDTQGTEAEYVTAELYRSFADETREVLDGIPEFISRAESRLSELAEEIEAKDTIIRGLTTRLEQLEQFIATLTTGRRGKIARSLPEEQALEAAENQLVDISANWEPGARERVVRELMNQGRVGEATSLALGWLKVPANTSKDDTIHDPLLPGSPSYNPTAPGNLPPQ